MTGMWKLHHMLGEVLGLMLTNRTDEGTAAICQLQKVLLQLGIDNGEWTTASLLWMTPHPLGQEDFGGRPDEMAAVHKYRKALAELKTRGRPPHAHAEDDESEDAKEGTRGGHHRKKKGGGRGSGDAAPK